MESLCQFFNTLPLEIYQPVDSFYLPEKNIVLLTERNRTYVSFICQRMAYPLIMFPG